MMDQEGFRAYLHVPDFLDPTRRSQTYHFFTNVFTAGAIFCP